MHMLPVLLTLISSAYAVDINPSSNTAYGYLTRFGIPEAERIRKAEEAVLNESSKVSRIAGGLPAALGQYPYQAGIISEILGNNRQGMCGGSLITANRVLTAAHCWYDGQNQGWRLTIVLGSVYLFRGGIRLQTSAVQTHPQWTPLLVRNDIAVVYLHEVIQFSDTVAPVALPTEEVSLETYVGISAIATGFGITTNGEELTENQSLNQVRLKVIPNLVCSLSFPFIIQDSHLCTSGIGGISTCGGDSGGPLVVDKNNGRVLIGITSFGSALGCQFGLPAAFTRVSSFLSFIKEHV